MRTLIVLCIAGVLGAGCGPAAPSSGSPSAAGSPPVATGSPVAVVPGVGSAEPSPMGSPRPVPPGLIAFDRYDTAFGAEGPYLGSALIRGDGTGQEPLTFPIEAQVQGPTWSPEGDRLMVNTWSPDSQLLRPGILAADGTEFTTLEPDKLDAAPVCFDWSRDGKALICSFESDAEPDVDGLYTLRIDDLELERLTESPYHHVVGSAGECGGGDGRSMASPDGSLIAFVRQRCGTGANPSADETAAIELMAADGTSLRELVEQGGVKSHPGSQISWSPDDTRIAFGSQDGELFLVDIESGRVSAIPIPAEVGSHHADGPDWSPDGSRLVFSMFTDALGETELYTIGPDGTDLRQITTGEGSEHWARWGLPDTP